MKTPELSLTDHCGDRLHVLAVGTDLVFRTEIQCNSNIHRVRITSDQFAQIAALLPAQEPVGYANTYEDGSVAYFNTEKDATEYGEFRNSVRMAVPLYDRPQPAAPAVPAVEATQSVVDEIQRCMTEALSSVLSSSLYCSIKPDFAAALAKIKVVPEAAEKKDDSINFYKKDGIIRFGSLPVTDTPETVALLTSLEDQVRILSFAAKQPGMYEALTDLQSQIRSRLAATK